MDCNLKILDGRCDVSDVSATPIQLREAVQIVEGLYAKYTCYDIDSSRVLALTALKLASYQIEPDSDMTDSERHNINVIINGIKLHLRADVREEYIYRKAAIVASNYFCKIKLNIPDEQELWYRVLLELALAIKIR